jgi:hypothetical protein
MVRMAAEARCDSQHRATRHGAVAEAIGARRTLENGSGSAAIVGLPKTDLGAPASTYMSDSGASRLIAIEKPIVCLWVAREVPQVGDTAVIIDGKNVHFLKIECGSVGTARCLAHHDDAVTVVGIDASDVEFLGSRRQLEHAHQRAGDAVDAGPVATQRTTATDMKSRGGRDVLQSLSQIKSPAANAAYASRILWTFGCSGIETSIVGTSRTWDQPLTVVWIGVRPWVSMVAATVAGRLGPSK